MPRDKAEEIEDATKDRPFSAREDLIPDGVHLGSHVPRPMNLPNYGQGSFTLNSPIECGFMSPEARELERVRSGMRRITLCGGCSKKPVFEKGSTVDIGIWNRDRHEVHALRALLEIRELEIADLKAKEEFLADKVEAQATRIQMLEFGEEGAADVVSELQSKVRFLASVAGTAVDLLKKE